jgi:hypothetical protein
LFTHIRKQEKRSSEPLAPEQFLSAFFLLLCGVCLAAGAEYSTPFYTFTPLLLKIYPGELKKTIVLTPSQEI